MKTTIGIMKYAILALLFSAGVVACGDKTSEEGNKPLSFALLDDSSNPVSGTQTFVFGAEKEFVLKVENVASVSTTRPAGWAVATNLRDKECIITAPLGTNPDAEAGGSIVFHLTGTNGKSEDYTIQVSAGEVDLQFNFTPPAETVEFAYNQSREYEFTASASFLNIEFSLPKGWSGTYVKGQTKFTVTAPVESVEKDTSGEVSVTPISQRGEKGAAIRFNVELLDATMPVLTLASSDGRFKFGTTVDITFTQTDVAELTVEAKPEGWTVNTDLSGGKVSITPPANLDAESTAYGGEIKIKAYNSSKSEEFIDEKTITVRLDGVANMTEFTFFAADYKKLLASEIQAAELDKYMQGGEIVLLDNIGPVEAANFITGTGGNPDNEHKIFTHKLNGLGHKITLNIDTNLYIFGSLFQAMAEPAELKNIVFDGKMKIATGTGSGTWGVFGGITGKSFGAAFDNVTAEFESIYAPADLLTTDNNHYYGGIVGWARTSTIAGMIHSPTKMTNCTTKGDITVDSGNGAPMYLSNLVAYVGDMGSEFTNCTNNGNIKIKAPATGGKWKNPARIGGLIGHVVENAGSGILMTNCVNSGDISIDANGREDIDAYIGGVAGTSCGTLKECKNYGNISSTSGSTNSRLGGITGHAQINNASGTVLIDDCQNCPYPGNAEKNGSISGTGNFIGGIAGCAYGNQSVVIRNCINKGVIWNHMAKNANYIAGICGYFSGKEISNCTNEGEVKGNVAGAAAGLIARADTGNGAGKDSPTTVNNCVNKGAMNITTTLTAKSGTGWLPLTAGLVCVGPATEADKDHYYSFTNCSNEGAINAAVTKKDNGCTQNIWILVRKHRADDPSLVDESTWITADQATATAQANRSLITETLKQ